MTAFTATGIPSTDADADGGLQPLRQLASLVGRAIAEGDLDGYVCALLVAPMDCTAGAAASPWKEDIERLLNSGPQNRQVRRPIDAAILGARLALGTDAAHAQTFVEAARREVEREPMPPAACMWDDDRILVGIAAGIGVAAPPLAVRLDERTQQRSSSSLRSRALDLWAQSLAHGTRGLTLAAAERARRLVTSAAPACGDDVIARFWLATRLLDADLQPTDEDLRAIDRAIAEGRRQSLMALARSGHVAPLDAALLHDALTVSPREKLARLNALDDVLAVIEAFPVAAAVLAKRGRGRPPFAIENEYDVQDLFRSMVVPAVPDLVPEDPAPKIAGHGSRLDFTSRATSLGFEIKYVDSPARANEVRSEILLDEATYHAHPYVRRVVAFVYDPGKCIAIAERPAFEADLSAPITVRGRTVDYVTKVRG
ncbi:MAG: hypothetical protein ACT4PV_15205 [Planctomycetaceae bacterium]